VGIEGPPAAAAARSVGGTPWRSLSACRRNTGHGSTACPRNLAESAPAEALRAITKIDLSELQPRAEGLALRSGPTYRAILPAFMASPHAA
jgi:hypothetical protein